MVFHWSLSDSKSPQVSRTLLSILAILSNTLVWIVSTRPPNSKSSRPFNNPLIIVLKAPITIGTIVTFMFYSFFNSLARSRYIIISIFPTNISWWFFIGVWVTASLLRCPRLFLIFLSISNDLSRAIVFPFGLKPFGKGMNFLSSSAMG